MEWLIAILTIVFTPSLTLLGTAIVERSKLKGKRMELEEKKDTALLDCQAKHAVNVEKIKNEFNTRLDEIQSSLSDIKNEQLRNTLTITQLQKDVQKHNGVMERTIILERDMAVLQNRESVSEHRLTDLEKSHAS
jgi:hypothetical protein